MTTLLSQGNTPENLVELLCKGLDPVIMDTIDTGFYCNCDKDRVEKALISIGKKELQEMIDEGENIEMKCHFCNTAYVFSVDDMKKLILRARA